ncbi:MAG: ABC transporter permease [Phycisphaerales bacterium]|nr:ABC transporter permease [Phycisphaerales bacterium]
MTASPVDVIEPAQMPATSRGGRANINRLGIGLWLLLTLVALVALSTPWAFGEVTLSGNVSAPRWAAGNLQLSLMPPLWMADQADMERAQKAREAKQYVPAMLLGTDRLGRDVFARLCAGSVISLSLGISAALVATAIGVFWGAAAAWFGGRVDSVLMRSVDVLYALPSMLLVTLLGVAVDGFAERALGDFAPTSRQVLNFFTMLVAISGVGWLTMSRVVRGQVLSLRERPYVEAARAAGAGTGRIFWWHLLPNLAGPVAAYAALAVPGAILSESFLSFLGIGIRDPLPSLGNLAAAGLPELNLVKGRWWLLVPPCAVVAFALLTLNFAADRLRDRLDPALAG